jgi:hemerythrin-like domain-containing protein
MINSSNQSGSRNPPPRQNTNPSRLEQTRSASGGIQQSHTEDHRHVQELLERFQALRTADRLSAKRAFQELRAKLERHIAWEERIVFPVFDHRCAATGRNPTPALRREHGQILVYLDDIAAKLEHESFDTLQDEENLQTALSLHNRTEQDELYPALEAVLKEQEREAIEAALARNNTSVP